jgi:preprotein translocase subunit SecG
VLPGAGCELLLLAALPPPGPSRGRGAAPGAARAQHPPAAPRPPNLLTKTTWVSATLFFVTSVTLAYVATSTGDTLEDLSEAPVTAPATPEPAADAPTTDEPAAEGAGSEDAPAEGSGDDSPGAHRIAAPGRLDLDHLGAEVGQELGAERPRDDAGQIDHPDPGKRHLAQPAAVATSSAPCRRRRGPAFIT